MANNHMDRLMSCVIKLYREFPFIADLLMNSEFEVSETVSTAQVGVEKGLPKIKFSPQFLDAIKDGELIGVILHEAMHVLMNHMGRADGRDFFVWNVACDYAINHIIETDLAPRSDIDMSLPEGACLDPELGVLSSEEIYEKIIEDMKDREALDNMIESSGDGKEGGSEGSSRASTEAMLDTVRGSCLEKLAAEYGSESGDIARAIGMLKETKVDWREVLDEYLTSAKDRDQSTYSIYNNRSPRDVILPKYYVDDNSINALIAIDTSGSMSNNDLGQAMSGVIEIADRFSSYHLGVLSCDTKCYLEDVIDSDDSNIVERVCESTTLTGGGGTDMNAPIEWVNSSEDSDEFDCLVIITDGYCPPVNAESDLPVIIISTKGKVDSIHPTLNI